MTRPEAVEVSNSEGSANLRGIVQIETGMHHSVALRKDGTAVGWGYNNYGQLGKTGTPKKIPIDLTYSDGSIIENITNIGLGVNQTYIETENKETGEVEVLAAGLNTSRTIGNKLKDQCISI